MADNPQSTALAPANDSPTPLDSPAQEVSQTGADQDVIETDLGSIVLPAAATPQVNDPLPSATEACQVSADELAVELDITTAMSESTTPTAGQTDLPQSLVSEPADIETASPTAAETDIVPIESSSDILNVSFQDKCAAMLDKYDEDIITGVLFVDQGKNEDINSLVGFKWFNGAFDYEIGQELHNSILRDHPIAFQHQLASTMASTIPSDRPDHRVASGSYLIPIIDIVKFGGFDILQKFLALTPSSDEFADLELQDIAIVVKDANRKSLSTDEFKSLVGIIKASRSLSKVYFVIPTGSEVDKSFVQSAQLALKMLEESWDDDHEIMEAVGAETKYVEIPELLICDEYDFAVEFMQYDGDPWENSSDDSLMATESQPDDSDSLMDDRE